MRHTQAFKRLQAALAAVLLTALSTVSTFGTVKNSAVQTGQPDSIRPGVLMYSINDLNNHLISFYSSAPGTIVSDVAITGLTSGDFIGGIDFRPATGQLYALAGTATSTVNRIYIINRVTGAATVVGSTPIPNDLNLAEEFAGMDFNPVVDRIRIITDGLGDGDGDNATAENIRVNPDNGTVAGTDTTPAFAAGDPNAAFPPAITQLAYTNNFVGATQTTLYGIDFASDSLVTVGSINGTPNSPNTGITNTVGSLGVTTQNGYGGFDINNSGTAYAALRISPDGATLASELYTINLATGAATDLGRIGNATVRAEGLAIAPASARTQYDFDGDKASDASVFRPSADPNQNFWYVLNSSNNSFSAVEWGQQGDKIAPADYDGDTKTDIAVWREAVDNEKAYFYIINSATNTARIEQFGNTGDKLTVGDWDNDGKADLSVYRAGATAGAQSFFFYRPSATAGVSFNSIPWGVNGDQSVRGDFDGDGKFDAVVYRTSNQTWYIRNSSDGTFREVQFGAAGDKTVAGDYDGDRKTDVAVFRPSTGTWIILQSSNSQVRYQQFGTGSDTLVQADYDADGRDDIAVWRAGTYIVLLQNTIIYQQWGVSGDQPTQAAYNQ